MLLTIAIVLATVAALLLAATAAAQFSRDPLQGGVMLVTVAPLGILVLIAAAIVAAIHYFIN